MSLIDYIITDLHQIENFSTVFLEIFLWTLHGNEVDHCSTSLITTATAQQLSNVMIEKFSEKTNYNVQMFQQLTNYTDWRDFCEQDWTEGMFTTPSIIIERALKKCAPVKTFFIRNAEGDISNQQKRVTQKTPKVKRQMNSRMSPKGMKYQNLLNYVFGKIRANFSDSQNSSYKNTSKGKDKWNFLSEARQTRQAKSMISFSEKSLGEIITDQKRKADLLIYIISKNESVGLIKPNIDHSSVEISSIEKPSSFSPSDSMNAGSKMRSRISIFVWVHPISQRPPWQTSWRSLLNHSVTWFNPFCMKGKSLTIWHKRLYFYESQYI